MSNPAFARWSVLVGISLAVLGMILFSQLGRIVNLRVSNTLLNTAAILSFSMTLLGLLGTLIGGVAWARRAPTVQVLWSAAAAGVTAILLAIFGDINVHESTFILMFVVFAAVIG
jgi:hypothetical protein